MRVTYSIPCVAGTQVPTLLHAADYYPYGSILRQHINGAQEKYLTTHHERDLETGLDYRGARYYDSDVARFLSLDPLAADYASWSPYNYVLANPASVTDPDGKFPWITMAVGAVAGAAVAVYDLSKQEGGFRNAMNKLASGDGKAWAHVGTMALTGVAVGSGYGGLTGAVGISATGSAVDQYVQTGTVDPNQVAVSAAMGGVGWGAGKLASSTILAPKTYSGTGLTPITEKVVIPKNNIPQVLGVEAGLATSSAVAEKVIGNAVSKPTTPVQPPTKASAAGSSTAATQYVRTAPQKDDTHITF